MTQIQALKAFFGTLPGQNATGFLKEIKALTEDERADLADQAAAILGTTIKT